MSRKAGKRIRQQRRVTEWYTTYDIIVWLTECGAIKYSDYILLNSHGKTPRLQFFLYTLHVRRLRLNFAYWRQFMQWPIHFIALEASEMMHFVAIRPQRSCIEFSLVYNDQWRLDRQRVATIAPKFVPVEKLSKLFPVFKFLSKDAKIWRIETPSLQNRNKIEISVGNLQLPVSPIFNAWCRWTRLARLA